MPWRLIAFLGALAVFVLFASFNAGNQADVSFAFYTFKNVPIFISLFLAFLLGALVTLPFSLHHRKGSRQSDSTKAPDKPKNKVSAKAEAPAIEPPDDNQHRSERSIEDDRIISEVLDSPEQPDAVKVQKKNLRGKISRRKKNAS